MKSLWLVPFLLVLVQCANKPVAPTAADTSTTAEGVHEIVLQVDLVKNRKKKVYELEGTGAIIFSKNMNETKTTPEGQTQLKLTCSLPIKIKFSGDKAKLEQSISKTMPNLDQLSIGKGFKAAKNTKYYYRSNFFAVKNGNLGNLTEGQLSNFEANYELQPNSYTKENSELLFLSRNGIGFGTTLAKESKSKASAILAFADSSEKENNSLCRDIANKGFKIP